MNTGEIIKYFRLARNMTQEQLAQDAEISFSTLRKYEANERNPKYEQLSKIADALGISVNLFMDFEIQSVSDLFSILFQMEGQADLEIATSKDLADLSEDTLFLHFKNGYINHILSNYHASVESIQDMDAQYRKKALSEIQNRLLDDNSSIHTDSPALSADSDKPALSLSSADQTWFELSSDCSDEEKEQMIKAAAFIKAVYDIPINKSLHKKDRCGNISLPASVSFYPMLFSTHEFLMAVHPDHGKMSFSFLCNHPNVPALFQFLSYSILLLYHLHSQL